MKSTVSEEVTCWSCGASYSDAIEVCPSCGVTKVRPSEPDKSQSALEEAAGLDFVIPDMDYVEGIKDETSSPKGQMDEGYQESSDELDFIIPDMDYVEGVKDETSSPKGQMDEGYQESSDELDFVIPDMDYVEGVKDETSSPKGQMDEGYQESSDELDFVIPDMDYVEGVKDETSSPKGQMDEGYQDSTSDDLALDFLDEVSTTETTGDDLSFLDEVSASTETTISNDEQSTLLADMDELMAEPEAIPGDDFDFSLPDMDGITNIEEDDDKKEVIVEETGISHLRELNKKSLFFLFGLNNVYWALVMSIVVFASYEVVNPNFNPTLLQPGDYIINPLGFWMGWISFLVTGWFISFKIRALGVAPRFYHAIIFFIVQYIIILILSQLALIVYNPDFLTGVYSSPNYLISSYFLYIPDFYLTLFISGGIVMYTLGFKFLWRVIYEITPRSELEPALAEF